MDFTSSTAVLQAKLQAWCVCLLSVPVDAYKLGAVIGKGAPIRTATGDALWPDVMFVLTEHRESVSAEAVAGAPALTIDIITSAMPEDQRAALCKRYAAAGVNEYWQIEADKASVFLYQANASGGLDPIQPDKAGIHFSSAIVELSFPIIWFRHQPDVWTMMSWWGMIHDDD
jgi:hypothetical protein